MLKFYSAFKSIWIWRPASHKLTALMDPHWPRIRLMQTLHQKTYRLLNQHQMWPWKVKY